MFIKIEIDTREELSAQDRAVLQALVTQGAAGGVTTTVVNVTGTAKKAAAPAKKAAAPKPEPVEEADQDLTDAAVARASELLSNGQRDRVLEALKDAGAGKVSEVSADKIADFLAALTD